MSEQPVITVSPVGLSNTDASILGVAVALLKKNEILLNVLEPDDTSGTILIVNMDNSEGLDFYNQFDYPRQQLMLLLASEIINDQRNAILKKPIRVQTLRDVLHDIYLQRIPKIQSATTVDKNKVSEKPVSFVQTDINNTLFFILWQAKQEKQVLQIFCSPHSPLFVDTAKEIIATSASRQTLRKIIQHPGQLRSTKLSGADFEVLARGQLILPLSHVLWSAALYGSNGQLIPTHSADVPVQLKAWPNLSRLEFEPEHMKLASVMATRAMSLKQLQQKIQLSWNTIVGFYNAAWTAGLIVINPANLPTASSAKNADKTGLFARIANRLRMA